VVVIGTAMLSGEPVPIKVPPQLPVYQVKVPVPVALRDMFPVVLLHIVVLSEVTLVGVLGNVFTVTTTFPQAEDVQPVTTLLT
jgi:hypothetical protein